MHSNLQITNNLDLKNPHFRYTGYPPAPPPGSYTKSPTELFYAQAASNAANANASVVAASGLVPNANPTPGDATDGNLGSSGQITVYQPTGGLLLPEVSALFPTHSGPGIQSLSVCLAYLPFFSITD
ncbi:unnamed protein product [Protopolystoma xenopodis]|uniref:Uncharacterized protein n=1 Tax=Protopolystoma xenopodis TaxID=117903 RepID=A0A3S5CRI1_9PLAT|nr:unnamed protein product [Protopolystoma xenopodis]